MTFRNQQDHLLAKNAVLEEQLREVEERAGQIARQQEKEYRKELEARRRLWWHDFFERVKIGSIAGLVCASVAATVYIGLHWVTEEKKTAAKTHQRTLGAMRAHVPAEISRSDWLRCIDHCARFGVKSAHNRPISEGIVIDTFTDYGDGSSSALFQVSVGGPWLDSAGSNYRSYTVSNEDTDPPGTRLRVGDKVCITAEGGGGGPPVFTFKVER